MQSNLMQTLPGKLTPIFSDYGGALRVVDNILARGAGQLRRPGAEFGGTENFFAGPKISE